MTLPVYLHASVEHLFLLYVHTSTVWVLIGVLTSPAAVRVKTLVVFVISNLSQLQLALTQHGNVNHTVQWSVCGTHCTEFCVVLAVPVSVCGPHCTGFCVWTALDVGLCVVNTMVFWVCGPISGTVFCVWFTLNRVLQPCLSPLNCVSTYPMSRSSS